MYMMFLYLVSSFYPVVSDQHSISMLQWLRDCPPPPQYRPPKCYIPLVAIFRGFNF